MTFLKRLLTDMRAAAAAEFALTVPLLLILLFSIIDGGRLMWEVNRAEKATQYGARYAIVTDVIPPQVVSENYVGRTYCENDTDASADVCTAGDLFYDTSTLGKLTCTSTSCTCEQGQFCPSGAAIGSTQFAALVQRMQAMYPRITSDNVQVTFRGSGLGFAGDPTGMDVVPLVTVELVNMTFKPITLFDTVTFNLPTFATTMTAESSAGSQSY